MLALSGRSIYLTIFVPLRDALKRDSTPGTETLGKFYQSMDLARPFCMSDPSSSIHTRLSTPKYSVTFLRIFLNFPQSVVPPAKHSRVARIRVHTIPDPVPNPLLIRRSGYKPGSGHPRTPRRHSSGFVRHVDPVPDWSRALRAVLFSCCMNIEKGKLGF